MPSPAMIKKAVADYFSATRVMDAEAWINSFAEDAVSHDPVGSVPIEGHKGLRRFYEQISMAFERVGLTEQEVFVAGNQAAVQWSGSGVGLNGREVAFRGIDVFEVNEQGKIQCLWSYWNPEALMAELMS
jgi:steroid delta-isomerase